MTDWVPVLIVALVVVCATAYLLLDPKLRPPRKRPLAPAPFTSRQRHHIGLVDIQAFFRRRRRRCDLRGNEYTS
jgi:hypothetical protein